MIVKPLNSTMTGELYQPVRLHYEVFDRKAVLRALKKLRCVERDPTRLRWVWLYDYKARNLSFQTSYEQIPEQYQPVVIGSFIPRNEDRMVLDLRSFERAWLAIPFFDKHIPRDAAKVFDAEVVNRLFSAEEKDSTPDEIFDRQETQVRDPKEIFRKIAELTAHVQDPKEKLQIVLQHSQEQSKEPLPEIERFPVHYYEEGIKSFTSRLKVRQLIAYQHWQGNTGYSMFDVMQQMTNSAGKKE